MFRQLILVVLIVAGCGEGVPQAKLTTRGGEVESNSLDWRGLEAAAAADPNLFASGFAGVFAKKPQKWRFVSNPAITNMRRNLSYGDKELEKLSSSVQLPVVGIMKYGTSHEGPNPTFQLGRRSKADYPKSDPVELLKLIFGQLRSSNIYEDLFIVDEVQSADIGGLKAATASYRYTQRFKSGEKFSILTTMCYAASSKSMFIIGMSCPPSGKDLSTSEFAAILNSLRLSD